MFLMELSFYSSVTVLHFGIYPEIILKTEEKCMHDTHSYYL